MTRFLVLAIVGLAVLAAAGPMLVMIARAAVPLVVVTGVVVLVLRVAWYFTHRW